MKLRVRCLAPGASSDVSRARGPFARMRSWTSAVDQSLGNKIVRATSGGSRYQGSLTTDDAQLYHAAAGVQIASPP